MAELDEFIAFLEQDQNEEVNKNELANGEANYQNEDIEFEEGSDPLFGSFSEDEGIEEGSVRKVEVPGWKPKGDSMDGDAKAKFTFGSVNSSSKPFKSADAVNSFQELPQEAIEFLGIRIINPTSSAQEINRYLIGKRVIKLLDIPRHVDRVKKEIEGDWITGGVVIERKNYQAKSSGKPYTILKLSDLRNLDKHISLFLFSESHASHWKIDAGSVIGLLNPLLMSSGGNSSKSGKYAKKSNHDEVCSLKLDHPLKLLLLGRSKDYGRCKSIKKNGEICCALINTSVSPVCVFHVNLDYKKMVSSRPELKATYSGMAPKSAMDSAEVNQCFVDKNFALLGPQGVKSNVVKKVVSAAEAASDFVASSNSTTNTNDKPEKTDDQKKTKKPKNFIELTEEEISRKKTLLKELDIRKELEAQMIQEAVKNPLTLAARNLAKVTEVIAKRDSKVVNNTDPVAELKKILEGKKRAPGQSSTLKVSTMAGSDVKVNLSKFASANDIFSQMKPIKEEILSAPRPQLGRGLKPGTQSILLDAKPQMNQRNKLQIRIPNRSRLPSNSKEASDIKSAMTKAQAIATLKRSSSQVINDPKAKAGEAKRKKLEAIRKRVESSLIEEEEFHSKKEQSAQVKEALDAALKRKSSHQKELKEIQFKQEDRYFQMMEKREMLEETISSTTSLTVDVVECKKCAYIEISQSDHCKKLGHLVLRRKGQKKFFKCNDCNKKIYIFDQILPVKPCRLCHGNSWSRASIGNLHSGPKNPSEQLMIRGEEVKFLNSVN